jgi:hypothetical protein
MDPFLLDHLSDSTLLRDTPLLAVRDRATATATLAHIAAVEARELYLQVPLPSMLSYCMHELGLSQDEALKRLRAARAARKFPVIFHALADGRLNLSAVVRLAPHLTAETVDELVAAAARRTHSEIKHLLALRFPRRGELDLQLVTEPPEAGQAAAGLNPGSDGRPASEDGETDLQVVTEPLGPAQLAANSSGDVSGNAPGRLGETLPPRAYSRATVIPLAPGVHSLQATIGQEAYDDLRYAQALLGHQVPSGDLAQVLGRALKALIGQIEKRKFAATSRPRKAGGSAQANGRYIPAAIKRAVWERDGGQCTFTSATGQRCPAKERLEFDHMDEVARGGQASVDRIRLLCQAHNQYAAGCTFGKEFMRGKREHGREACEARAAETPRAAAMRAGGETHAAHTTRPSDATPPACESDVSTDAPASTEELETASARAAAMAYARALEGRRALEVKRALDLDVMPWLRTLGFGAEERRIAACYCESMPEASLEQRVRAAIAFLRPGKPRTGRETWGHGEAASSSHAECARG